MNWERKRIMMAITKTNAMRILDAEKIPYSVHTYENKDGKIDGISVAGKIGKEIEVVYKTLVVKDAGSGIYVFVIPVEAELDLKKAAKVVNAKKLEMIAMKDIQKTTGYIRGGCSPIGMKKKYETILDVSVNKQSSIIVSGGKIGVQIEMAAEYLIQVTDAKVEEVIY